MSWLPRGECSGFNYNGAEQGLVLGVGKQPFEIEVDELKCNRHILSSLVELSESASSTAVACRLIN